MQHKPLQAERCEPVVGCWPGRSFEWNSFAAIFSDSLEAAGCQVVEVRDPRRLAQPVDILHIHWPDQIFWGGTGTLRAAYRIGSTLRALRRLRSRGTRIVWMVHNLQPHDLSGPRRWLWRWFSAGVGRLADGFMTLSPATVPIVRSSFAGLRGKPAAFAWHPAYPRLRVLPDRSATRAALGVGKNETLTAFLGLIRPYKGVGELITAFRLKAANHARLLVAGHCEDSAAREMLETTCAGDPRVILAIGRLSDEDFAGYLLAADRIALPYRQYLHSGSIIHALSYERPVLTPAAPFAEALAERLGHTWLRTYSEEDIPADAFDSFSVDETRPDLTLLDPSHIGIAAIRLYRQLLRPSEASLCPEGGTPSLHMGAVS